MMKLSDVSIPTVEQGSLDALVGAYHGDPFAVLGMHQVGERLTVRVFRPEARAVTVREVDGQREWPAVQVHADGFFEAVLEGAEQRFRYALAFTAHDGHAWTERDPYSFGTILGPLDLHLFAEGQHWQLYEKLGAHLTEIDGARGTTFHVWAPNAQRVSVVGDFNRWDGRVHPLRKLLGCGVWEIFLPGVGEGAHYKFEVKQAHGGLALKCDPFAFFSQHGTATSSLVFDLHRYAWSDAAWMEARKGKEWHREPVSIYEVHLGSWQRKPEEGNRLLSYREFADTLLPYVVEMGYTHVELLPVAEHPFEGSWGYQVTGFFAPTSRFGNPDEFRYLVDRFHQAGIGVILDWVPGHFPKDAHGLAEFDGTDLFEHADPRQGEHREWGTLIFNYGRNEVRNFLIANALFWLDEYHIDGLRVDAVASMLYLDYSRQPGEWIPNQFGGRENLDAIHFLKRFNEVCYERHPGIMTIAEESTAWPGVSHPLARGGLGFTYKWNMGWMHDTLAYMRHDPVHRRHHHALLTFGLIYAFNEDFVLPLSHDEVVHGKGSLLTKMPGDRWQQFANLRLYFGFMWAHPGKKLLFMGGEFGQAAEWNHDAQLDWAALADTQHAGVRRLVADLNRLYRTLPALHQCDCEARGFEWIDFEDHEQSVLAFIRRGRDDAALVLAVLNFTPVPRPGYRIGVPRAGHYRELLNSDSALYGGSNMGNAGGLDTLAAPCHGREHSLTLTLPPLSCVLLGWGT